MKVMPHAALFAILAVAASTACSTRPAGVLSDGAKRKEIIEALATDPAMRQEVIDRLIGPPESRTAVVERILKNEDAIGTLIEKIMAEDRGKAIVASKVASDSGAKTFIRMLMLTGVMGDSMTQPQANALGLGEPFALGNQRRTMLDMKRIGRIVEEARARGGRYPICNDFGGVSQCVSRQLPGGSLEGLRLVDAWGKAILYHSDREGSQYALISHATDGLDDGMGKVGPTHDFNCDIVFSNGDFLQWPGWIRKDEIR